MNQPLSWLHAPNEKNVWNTITIFCNWYGAAVSRRLDAIRQNLVFARKVATDEVPGCGAYGNTTVKL